MERERLRCRGCCHHSHLSPLLSFAPSSPQPMASVVPRRQSLCSSSNQSPFLTHLRLSPPPSPSRPPPHHCRPCTGDPPRGPPRCQVGVGVRVVDARVGVDLGDNVVNVFGDLLVGGGVGVGVELISASQSMSSSVHIHPHSFPYTPIKITNPSCSFESLKITLVRFPCSSGMLPSKPLYRIMIISSELIWPSSGGIFPVRLLLERPKNLSIFKLL